MTEQEYRAVKVDSYSSLKWIANPFYGVRKYKKLYIDNIPDKESDENKEFLKLGSLVDCMLFTPEDIDKRYYISDESIVLPTGNEYKFAHHLYKLTLEANSNGVNLEEKFGEICQQAYDNAGIKRPTYETFIKVFLEGSNTEKYYQQLLAATGKEVITVGEINNAHNVVNTLKTNRFTKHIFEGEFFPQVKVFFEYEGRKLKGMLDLVVPDHKAKTLAPWDLKCKALPEDFDWDYRKMYYYLQHAIYMMGLRVWADENGYGDYEILPFQYLVASSTDYTDPLIFQTSSSMVNEAINGFTYRGRQFKGLDEIISEIQWAEENDIWRISRRDFELKAIRQLKY